MTGLTNTVPDRPPLPPTRAQRRAVVLRTWAALLVLAAVGSVVYALVSPHPHKAVPSLLGAAALVLVLLEASMYNLRAGNRISPAVGFAAAVFSYSITVLALGIALAAASPRIVDPAAVAVGMVGALAVWTIGLVARTRVRVDNGPEARSERA